MGAQLRQQQQWAQQHVQEQQQLQQQRDAEAQVAAGESYNELRKRNRTAPGYSVAPSQAGLPAHPTRNRICSSSLTSHPLFHLLHLHPQDREILQTNMETK